MPLKEGDRAPPFEAQDQDGQTVRSEALDGTRHVLYFYPHDDTPICTRQAHGFKSLLDDFSELGVPVFGVSPDPVEKHARFAERHDLGFRLLADPKRQMIRDYDVAGLLGRTSRVTYIIGPDGRIEGVRKAELSGKGHAEWAKEQVAGRETDAKTPGTAAPGR